MPFYSNIVVQIFVSIFIFTIHTQMKFCRAMTQYIIVLLLGVSLMILDVEAACGEYPRRGKCGWKGGGHLGELTRPESLGMWTPNGIWIPKESGGLFPNSMCKDLEQYGMEVRNCMAEEGCCSDLVEYQATPDTGTTSPDCPHNYVPECTITNDPIVHSETLQDVYGNLCEIESFHRCTSNIPLDCNHFDEIRKCAVVHRCCSRLDHPPYTNVRSALPSIPSLGDCMGLGQDSLQHHCYDGNLQKTGNRAQTDCDPVEWETCQNTYHMYLGKFNTTERTDCGMIKPGRNRLKKCAMDENTMCVTEFNQYRDNWMEYGSYCTDPSTFPRARNQQPVVP